MNGLEEVPADRVRNVVLLGHAGTGKTTLAEALLAAGDGDGARGGPLDREPEERERGHSLSLAVGSLTYRGHKVNVLDTPGSAEAIGDAYPALLAADVAVFVVDAALGLQPQHDDLWGACGQLGLPRLVFLNKLDKRDAAFQTVVDALRERYGKPLAPVHLPLGVGEEFTGVVDLLHEVAVQRGPGGSGQGPNRIEGPVPAERAEQAARNRELLVEAIVENDDELLERYLDGEVPEPRRLAEVFATGICGCGFFPLLCGSAAERVGVRLLLDFLLEECPSPLDRPLEGVAPDGPPVAYVAKTFSDPYVGRINVARVLAGRVAPDDELVDARTGARVRLHQLVSPDGGQQRLAGRVGTGDLFAVAKLEDVRTGDVLCGPGVRVSLPEVAPPAPHHRVALEPLGVGDEDKLSTALARLAEEDPTLRVDRDPETAQLVLTAYGPTHVDVALARMRRKFHVGVRQVPLRLRYRETLAGPGKAVGRHVKQSGGHGQYAIAHLEVEPLPPGGGFSFEDRIVGGAIPRQYIGSVEKGVREAMAQGVLAGYPMVDVRARLVDGKTHSVDSSDMAFQVAGSLAFRQAAEAAGVVLLEPIKEVEVSAPDTLVGDVLGDLSARRGRISGTEQTVPGRSLIRALVPEAELLTYVAELRSLTSGTGTVRLRDAGHDQVPESHARRIVAEAR
jgi:elongation factor G